MNQTIYFRKDVWDKFKDEAGKSNLVNQLLATHYSLNPREITVDDRPLPKQAKQDLPNYIDITAELEKNPTPAELPPTSDPFEGYAYHAATNAVYDTLTGERVPAKVKDGKIIELL